MNEISPSLATKNAANSQDLPDGWRYRDIGDVCKIFGRIGFRGYTVNDIVAEGQGAISLSPSNIQGSRLTLARNTFISWEKWEESPEIKIENGDIILVKTGSTVGKAAIVRGLSVPATLNPQMVTFKRRRIDETFLGYVVTSEEFQSQLAATAVGGALPTLSQKEIAGYRFACPDDPKEQQAIAEALSDADALIEGLERLIAKKRLIKQGAMQDLLTAKRRLPGFSGEWVDSELGDIAKLYQPVTISAQRMTDHGFPVYGANGIVGCFHEYNHESWQCIITCRGSTCGTVNRTVDKSWITGNAMVANVDTNPRIDKGFFYQALLGQDFSICITGTGQPQIVRGPLAAFSIKLPAELQEQRAIAGALTDMDAEIQALETRLEKARQVKEGMMQNLLTGRIRLV